MFCKVCFDSGRSTYESHNVKDFAGNVSCPYLLSITCKLCGGKGHTVKYCKKFKIAEHDNCCKSTFVNDKENAVKPVATKPVATKSVAVKSVAVASVSSAAPTVASVKLNMFDVLTSIDNIDNITNIINTENDSWLIHPNDIVWGKGSLSMMNVLWADACGA